MTGEIDDFTKIYINSIEKNSDRRTSTNKFFLTLNSLILTFFCSLFSLFKDNVKYRNLLVWFIWAVGIIFNMIYLIMIYSFRKLSKLKFNILKEFCCKNKYVNLYALEDDARKKKNIKYFSFTSIEIFIPIVFVLILTVLILLILFVIK